MARLQVPTTKQHVVVVVPPILSAATFAAPST
jgi:hypothetical protein